MREIEEEKIQEVYDSVHNLISTHIDNGDILNYEIVYGVLTALIDCTDDKSQSFTNFIQEALGEVICQKEFSFEGEIH